MFGKRIITNLVQAFQEWRKRRYWEKRHLQFLRTLVSLDACWLSVDPVAKEITERYQKAVSPLWYTHSFEDISDFRRRLGLDPVYNEKKK